MTGKYLIPVTFHHNHVQSYVIQQLFHLDPHKLISFLSIASCKNLWCFHGKFKILDVFISRKKNQLSLPCCHCMVQWSERRFVYFHIFFSKLFFSLFFCYSTSSNWRMGKYNSWNIFVILFQTRFIVEKPVIKFLVKISKKLKSNFQCNFE